MTAQLVRIASYPERNPGNPVLELFGNALAEYGVHVVARLQIDREWLRSCRSELDAIFVHWPERIWRGRIRGRLDRVQAALTFRRLRRLVTLARFLSTAHRLGIVRVWTVHNLGHHEGTGWADRIGYRILATQCDLLVCYSASAAQAIRRQYGPNRPLLVIKHGSYKGVYPPPRPRHAVLTELGLQPGLPVVCCVGLLRKYKGTEVACEAVRRLAGRVQLVVAGHPRSQDEREGISRAMNGLPGAVLLAKTLSDQEFSDLVAACDAVLLPYSEITGSGLLLAAWTLGCGVVASDLPYFAEMIPAGSDSGLLFSTGDSNALAEAITRYLDVPAERRRAAALEQADFYSWTRCVEPLARMLIDRKHGAVRHSPSMQGSEKGWRR
jgi:beta-1,4-mannosyltransferase